MVRWATSFPQTFKLGVHPEITPFASAEPFLKGLVEWLVTVTTVFWFRLVHPTSADPDPFAIVFPERMRERRGPI